MTSQGKLLNLRCLHVYDSVPTFNSLMHFSLKVIEKAIVSSDVGLTPNNDGEVIRLSIPQLTSERRKVSCSLYPILEKPITYTAL